MSKSEVFKVTIPPDFKGQRLDKALAMLLVEQMPALSRVRIKALIEDNLVTSRKETVSDVSLKVKADEIYEIQIPPPEPAEPLAQKMELKVLHEDKDILVIDKPAGMVVHPAPGNREGTLVNALLAHCGESLSGIGGVARPGIVHRLDKDTSGLMIVAKNDLAHQALTDQFSDRSLSRVYQALVWGVPTPAEGSIEASIGRHSRDRKKMAVSAKGKVALTHYKILKSFGFASLVECRLATGRTHQIRVHLAYRKHPVIGDVTYGGQRTYGAGALAVALHAFPRQALHAVELQFIHPRSGKSMRFKSALPKDMAKLLKYIEAHKA